MYNDRHLHHRSYTPVWEALEETGLPIVFHPAGLTDMPGASRALGGLDGAGHAPRVDPADRPAITLSNLVYGGVLEQFPELKVIVLECGGGWIAHWMDRLDEFLESYGWATPTLSLTPREYFQRQCWISFDPGERTAPVLWPLIGADRFMWASDFPHCDAKYPGVVDELREYTEGMDETARAGLFGTQRGRDVRLESAAWQRRGSTSSSRGGTVVDGTGATRAHRRRRDRQRADRRGRSRRRTVPHASAIDADGLLVTPGFRRHTHALRRAAALGPDRVTRFVARRDDPDDGQLRLHARAEQARGSSTGCS